MVGAVKGGSVNPHPVIGGLYDGILFGMEAPTELVSFTGRDPLFLTETAGIEAVIEPGRGAVITRCQNLFVFDQDGSHLSPEAGGAFGNKTGNVHKVFFPGGSLRMNLFFRFLFQGYAIKKIKFETTQIAP